MAKSELLEVEIDSINNRDLFFDPLRRVLRGKFDVHRCTEQNAMTLTQRYPPTIPGTRVQIDVAAGTAEIVEPLHRPEYAQVRDRITKQAKSLPPEREQFDISDPNVLASWVYWLKRGIAAKAATLVSGQFPENLPGTPKTHYIRRERKNDSAVLADAIREQTAAQERQTAVMLKLVETLANKKA